MTKCLMLLSHENNLYRDEPFFQRMSRLGFSQNNSSASSCGAALCGDLVMGEARRWFMMMSLSYLPNSSASLCKLRHCHPRHCSHQDRNVLLHKKGTRNKFALIFSNTLSKGTSPPKPPPSRKIWKCLHLCFFQWLQSLVYTDSYLGLKCNRYLFKIIACARFSVRSNWSGGWASIFLHYGTAARLNPLTYPLGCVSRSLPPSSPRYSSWIRFHSTFSTLLKAWIFKQGGKKDGR